METNVETGGPRFVLCGIGTIFRHFPPAPAGLLDPRAIRTIFLPD
jgi:hypothetical protein